MVTIVRRLWLWLHTHEGRKISRFMTVSLINTSVSFAVLAIVFGWLRLWSQIPSTVFANFVATFPSYFLNRQWAWGKRGRSHLTKEVLPFWLMAAAGITFSILGASLAHYLSGAYHLDHFESTVLVLSANVLSFAIFWVLKLLLFNRIFRVDELEEIDEHLEAEEHLIEGTSGAPGSSIAVE